MSDSSGCSSPSPSHNRPIWTRGRRATEEEGEGAAISQFLESGSKQFLVDPMKWEDDDIGTRRMFPPAVCSGDTDIEH